MYLFSTLWWNVAAENQAVSRAPGSGKNGRYSSIVLLLPEHSRKKILANPERKQRLADSGITAATSIPLTDEELLEVL